jgi:hypothetical protein
MRAITEPQGYSPLFIGGVIAKRCERALQPYISVEIRGSIADFVVLPDSPPRFCSAQEDRHNGRTRIASPSRTCF